MRKIFRIIGALLAAIVLMTACLVAALALSAERPVRTIGIQQELAADPGHPPVVLVLFYPTDAEPRLHWMGTAFAWLASNAPIAGERLPMVVISHGTAGTVTSHLDTTFALVQAGYVVAVPLHNGDNFRDDSEVGTSDWFVDRARQIARVNDFVLERWKDRAHVDPRRLGLFGFSAGGTTALIDVGGTPDLARIEPLCQSHPEFVCKLRQAGQPMRIPAPAEWTHDDRIRAAVVVAPGYGFTFQPNGLNSVRIPVQLWEGSADTTLPLPTNAGAVRQLLPEAPEFHLVDSADHFSFLAPCGLGAALLTKQLCTDPPGFDRKAFHREFDAAVVGFFDRALRPS